jgi:hypothetical protein
LCESSAHWPQQSPSPLLRTRRIAPRVAQSLRAADTFFPARTAPISFASSSSRRQVIVPPGAPTTDIACFVQTNSAPAGTSTGSDPTASGWRRALVIVVPTFFILPHTPEYVDAFAAVGRCLAAVGPDDAVVIDLRVTSMSTE